MGVGARTRDTAWMFLAASHGATCRPSVSYMAISVVVLTVFLITCFAFTMSEGRRDDSWAFGYDQVQCGDLDEDDLPYVVVAQEEPPPFWNTQEFQIKLNHDLWGRNRREELIRVMSYVDQATPLQLDRDSVVVSIREQHSIGVHECERDRSAEDPGMMLRLRTTYCGSNHRQFSYIDAKYSPLKAYERYGDWEPFVALPRSATGSAVKREQDVHPCHTKWSRSARAYVPFQPTLKTCADVSEYFPNLCRDDACMAGKLGTVHVKSYWWVMSWTGTLDGFRVKVGITVPYKSVDDAVAGTDRLDYSRDPEWSVRVYVSQDDDWQLSEDVKANMLSWRIVNFNSIYPLKVL